jgi:small subunit ribosomal protein S21
MIRVRARGDEPLEQLLKRFKKICEKEGLTKEIKRTSYYEKPSEAKRRKVRQMIKKELKRVALKEKMGQRRRPR